MTLTACSFKAIPSVTVTQNVNLIQLLYGGDGGNGNNGHEAISARLGLGPGDRGGLDGARGFRSEVRRIGSDEVVDSRSHRMQTDGSYEFKLEHLHHFIFVLINTASLI